MTVADTGRRRAAPFDTDEVVSMNTFQVSGRAHPFTCGNDECRGPDHLAGRAVLKADVVGWTCQYCDYMQEWAWEWMTDWSWEDPGPWALIVFTSGR